MHAQRVFRCEECHSYLDKNDLLFHMSQHAFQLSSQCENNKNRSNRDGSNHDESSLNESIRNESNILRTEKNDYIMAGIPESNDKDLTNRFYERVFEVDEKNKNNTNNQDSIIEEDDIKREGEHEQPESAHNEKPVQEHKTSSLTENKDQKHDKDNSNRKRDHQGDSVSSKKRDHERKEVRRTPKTDNRIKSHLETVISRIIQLTPVECLLMQKSMNLKLKDIDRPASTVQGTQDIDIETCNMIAKQRPKRRKTEVSIKNDLSENIDDQMSPENKNDNDGDDEVDVPKRSPKVKVAKLIKNKLKTEKSPKASRTCPICGKEYRASSSYFYHMKYFHKRSRDHECQACGKKFGTKANLAQHASIHTGAYELECKECGKRFRSKPSLYIHEQSHGGVKRWACGQCERSFRWRTHLARHVQRHTAARGHVCATCGRGFSVRCDLLRHARTHAAAEFHCAACGLKFAQKRYLKVHMIKKHFNNQHHHQPAAPSAAAQEPSQVVTRS